MHVQTIDPHVVSDPAALQLGAVLPHHEIGTDRGAIKSYLEGVEALGLSHLLVYDHVLGASRDRKGGFDGHYDSEVAFHEPFTFLAFAAAVTNTIELATNVLILPQRQTALVPSKRRRYRTCRTDGCASRWESGGTGSSTSRSPCRSTGAATALTIRSR